MEPLYVLGGGFIAGALARIATHVPVKPVVDLTDPRLMIFEKPKQTMAEVVAALDGPNKEKPGLVKFDLLGIRAKGEPISTSKTSPKKFLSDFFNLVKVAFGTPRHPIRDKKPTNLVFNEHMEIASLSEFPDIDKDYTDEVRKTIAKNFEAMDKASKMFFYETYGPIPLTLGTMKVHARLTFPQKNGDKTLFPNLDCEETWKKLYDEVIEYVHTTFEFDQMLKEHLVSALETEKEYVRKQRCKGRDLERCEAGVYFSDIGLIRTCLQRHQKLNPKKGPPKESRWPDPAPDTRRKKPEEPKPEEKKGSDAQTYALWGVVAAQVAALIYIVFVI